MVVLIDTNILLDFLQNREANGEYANKIIKMCAKKTISGFIAAKGIYIVKAGMQSMLKAADKACLFRAPDSVKKEFPQFKAVEEYEELLEALQ